MADLTGVGCVPAWMGDIGEPPRKHHRTGEYARSPFEWMPRPFAGRVMLSNRMTSGEGIYLEVVPGPNRTWQLVRVELSTPVARGFATPEKAREWVARAIRAGVLPKEVMVVEPPTGGGDAE
jgi:hypothetical protein